MSNLFKYTKRVLTSVLAAAVVLTAIPSTAFGAEIDEDLAIEVQETEVAEAGEEVVVENEDALTTDGASGDEEIVVEEEENEPDQATADTVVAFVYTDTNVAAYDPLSEDGADAITTANGYQVNATIGDSAGDIDNAIAWDSTQNLELELKPETGYKFATDAASKVVAKYTYRDASGTDHPNQSMDSNQYTVTRNGDKSVTLKINSSFMTQLKTATKSTNKPLITVTAAASTTAVDSFFVKVDPTTIIKFADPNKAISASYGAADLEINFTGHERSDFPLTGVEVYLGNEKQKSATTRSNVGTDGEFYFTSAADLLIDNALVDSAYTTGKDITIKGLSENFTITQDAQNKSKYGSELTFTQTSAKTRSTNFDDPIVVTATHPTTSVGRALAGIEYTVTYANGTTKKGIDDSSSFEVPAAALKNSGSKATAVVVSGVYSETIQWKSGSAFAIDETGLTAGTAYTSILAGADKAFVFENGEDAKLTIAAVGSNSIDKVEYMVGKDTTKHTAARTANTNIYTIPKADVNNIVSVIVTTKTATRNIGVKGAAISGVTVRDVDTNTALDSSYKPLATINNDFLFTVTPTAGTSSVAKVQYTLNGAALADDSPEATAVNKDKGIYKIPASVLTGEMNVDIHVTTGTMKQVIVPKNPKAVIYVNGVAKTEDFYVPADAAFTFSVQARKGANDGNVVISKVALSGATTVTDTATDTTPVQGTYTLSESVMKASATALTVKVDTTEEAKAGTYSVKVAPNNNGIWAGEWKAGTDGANKKYTDRSIAPTETLFIALTDTAVLTPAVEYTKSVSATTDEPKTAASLSTAAFTNAKTAGTKYEQTSTLEGAKKIVNAAKTSGSYSTADIVGNQVGTETVKGTFVIDDTYNSDTEHNFVTFTANLNVEVKPHYEVALTTVPANAVTVAVESTVKNATNSDDKLAAAMDSSVTNKVLATLTATNVVTRADVSSTVSDGKIAWDSVAAPWYVTAGTDITTTALTNDRTAQIVAGDTAAAKSFNVTITEGKDADGNDIKYTAATPVTLEAIESDKIVVAATIDVEGGAKDWTQAASPAVALDATTLKKATVTYKLYKIVAKDTSGWDAVGDYTSEDKVKQGLEKGYIEDVTSSATIKMDYYKTADPDKTKLVGLTITPSTGNVYTLNATAKTSDTTTMYTTATYNKVSFDVPQPVVTVNKSVKRIAVPLKLDTTGLTGLKLNSSYLSKFDTYSIGWEAGSEDGYLFQIPAGTKFTLPTEADLDATVYKDAAKEKSLVGWTVTAANGNIHGRTDLGSGKVFFPGETIVIDNNAITLTIAPAWAARYSFAGLYSNPDGSEEYDVVTNSLVNNVVTANVTKGTKPETIQAIGSTKTIPVGSDISIGAIVANNIAYSTATKDGKYPAGTKYTKDTGSETDAVNRNNNIYPGNGTGSGKVAWYTYDGNSDLRTAALAPGASDADKKALTDALAAAKNIDKDKLAEGKLVGKTAGYAMLYATYTDQNGNVYYSDQVTVTVSGAVDVWSIDASKLLEVTVSGTKSNSIEVGQEVTTTSANGLIIKKGLDAQTGLQPSGGAKIVWTYDDTVLKIDDNKGVDVALPKITGLKESSGTLVKVQYIDANGAKSNEATVTVKVVKPDVNLVWTNSTGSILSTDPTGEVLAKGTDTGLYMRALDPSGNDLAGVTVTFSSDNDDVIKAPASALSPTNGVYHLVGQAGDEFDLDSATVTVTATKDTKTYQKTATVKNYATVTFDASAASFANSVAPTHASSMQINGSTSTKVKVTGVGGEAKTEAGDNQDYVIKVFKDDLDSDKKCKIDLTKFSAEYSGDYKDEVSFVGFDPAVVAVSAIKDSYDFDASSLAANNVALKPLFGHAAITSLTTNISSIEFNNLEADALTESKTVIVSAKPKDSLATVSVKSSASNTGAIDNFFDLVDGDTAGSGAVDSVNLTTSNSGTLSTDSVRQFKFTVRPETTEAHVGTTTLTVSAAGSDAKAEVSLKIYGQYEELPIGSGNYRYKKADGTDAVDTSITYKSSATGTTEVFYDAKGYKITTKGPAKDAAGKLILLDSTGARIKDSGFYTSADAAGNNYFVGEDGSIVAGKFVTITGKQMYANAKGVVVTYDMAKDDRGTDADGKKFGKYTDPDTKATYVIYEDGSAKQDDKKIVTSVSEFTWTPSKAKDYTRGVTNPTATVTVNFKFEKAGKTDKEVLTAKVEKDSSASTAKKDVFKATVTASGYYDSKGNEYDFSKVTSSKTYTVDDSGHGVTGGIEIVDLTEGQEFTFTGNAIKPTFTVHDNDADKDLAYKVDYDLSFKNNTKITVDSSKMPTVTVSGKGNYAGKTVTRTFKIVKADTASLEGNVKGIDKITEKFTYNGEEQYPEKITVNFTDKSQAVFEHVSGDSYNNTTTGSTKDVVFSFSNNKDAGTATVAATGKDGVTKKATFKINKVDLSAVPTASLDIDPDDVEWAAKGAVPAVSVTYTPDGGSPITLLPGQDFKVNKVNYATKGKDAAEKNTVTIEGKGTNFTKKATSSKEFEIKKYELTEDSIFSVTAYAGQKVSAAKVVVIDKAGAVIPAKNNYTVKFLDSDNNEITDAKNTKFEDGKDYAVVVEAISGGNLDSSASREFKAASDMSKAKVELSGVAKDGVEYTGSEIELTAVQVGDNIVNLFDEGYIKVSFKNSSKTQVPLTYGTDYEVTGYQNNVKKGTMTVYITGKPDNGKVSGTKSFKVKIKAKTMKKADD